MRPSRIVALTIVIALFAAATVTHLGLYPGGRDAEIDGVQVRAPIGYGFDELDEEQRTTLGSNGEIGTVNALELDRKRVGTRRARTTPVGLLVVHRTERLGTDDGVALLDEIALNLAPTGSGAPEEVRLGSTGRPGLVIDGDQRLVAWTQAPDRVVVLLGYEHLGIEHMQGIAANSIDAAAGTQAYPSGQDSARPVPGPRS